MKTIYKVNGKIDLAITLKDDLAVKKSGRVYIDDFCNEKNIKLVKCNNINDPDIINVINTNEIDWLFIIGWSQIASLHVLSSVNLGVLGIHPTLLPKGRGRASIPWAILKKLKKTGVTLFKLDEGVDTGDIIDQVEIKMRSNISATELYFEVTKAHKMLIKKIVPKLYLNTVELTPQDNDFSTYWPGRKPEDGEINLNGSVFDAECLVRATTQPYPGAFLFHKGKKLKIWKSRITHDSKSNCLEFHDGFLELIDFEFSDK